MKVINLSRSRKQLNILEWALDAIDNLTDQDKLDLHGVILNKPYTRNGGIINLRDEIIDDLKFRITDQYLDMASDVEWDEVNNKPFNYANEERAAYELWNKIEQA